MPRDTGTRLNRLEELKGLLKARDHVTASALADELGVSLRTLNRDLAILREAGTPIDSDRGRGGGLRLQSNWALGRLHLSPGEAIDLLLSLALAEHLKLPLLLRNLAPIRRKITAAFGERYQARIKSLRRRIIVAAPASAQVLASYAPPAGKHLTAINAGFFDHQCLQIDYADRDGVLTTRVIEPQFVLLSPPVWYILAFDRLRGGIRHFRVDRIRHASKLDERFRLGDPRPYLASAEAGPGGI
jgi:predicted DNA-binding transcriptional regulator YafY